MTAFLEKSPTIKLKTTSSPPTTLTTTIFASTRRERKTTPPYKQVRSLRPDRPHGETDRTDMSRDTTRNGFLSS